MRIRTRAGLTAAGLALTLGATLATSIPATAGPGNGNGNQGNSSSPAARAALAAAKAALSDAGASHSTAQADGRDLTLVMRDLTVARQQLRGEDRAAADRLLARPTTPPDDPEDPRDIYYGADADVQQRCSPAFCLHWVETGEHATTPAFAATAYDTIRDVAATYLAAGFRAPLPDEGQEGDTRTDFYLGDIDTYGALGYCRSDATAPVVGSAYYAYCGFDNDYASSPWLDPTSLLRITVAHEYFHAVQFAYDAEEEGWLMESMATAMEDELYDDVDDNASFLGYGQLGDPAATGYPLSGPSTPLDTFDYTAYGNWIFWRYLAEQHPDRRAGVPNLFREVWEALDTTRGRPVAATALDAIDTVLAKRRTSTPDQYVAFAAANQHPEDVYREAAELGYPTAPDTLPTVGLTRTSNHATLAASLDHLTSATGTVLPFTGSKQLKVRVDLGDARGRAAVTVHKAGGATETSYVAVNKQGNGSVTVPFASGAVTRVEVTVANGGSSDRMAADVRYQAVG